MEVESLSYRGAFSRPLILLVLNFCVEIRHLGVILNAKTIVEVSTNAEPLPVHGDDSVSRRAFKDMKLYHLFLGGEDHLEF